MGVERRNIHGQLKRVFYAGIILSVWLSTLSCLTISYSGQVPENQPTISLKPPTQVEATQKPAPTAAPASTMPAAITDEPPGMLGTIGPWLLISTTNGLWAINSDGSGLKKLTAQTVAAPRLIAGGVAPSGGRVAFITASDESGIHDLTLNLLSLADGKSEVITPLTSDSTEPADSASEAVRAITEFDSMAWSPDGKTLAFVGAQDGDVADLYAYSLDTQRITRLTKLKSHAYAPSWSPDGKVIILLGADNFGSGDGFVTAGVWEVKPDGSGLTYLYVPDGTEENLAGWLDPSTYLLYSWTHKCGGAKLRTRKVVESGEKVLYKGTFSSAALADNGNVLLTGNAPAGCAGSIGEGVFLLTAGQTTPKKLFSTKTTFARWFPDPQSVFFIRAPGNGAISLNRDGGDRYDSPPKDSYFVQLAAYGAYWAWTSQSKSAPGVWLQGLGQPEQQLFDQAASFPAWSLENDLFFFNGMNLYRARFPDYKAEEIGRVTGTVLSVAWVK